MNLYFLIAVCLLLSIGMITFVPSEHSEHYVMQYPCCDWLNACPYTGERCVEGKCAKVVN